MLLHIRPRFFSRYGNADRITLVDLTIEPFSLCLRGGVDLVTRRPYPNKGYAVACRKQGQKAIDGILIETASPVDAFDTTARWAVEADFMVTHRVSYSLLDHDFDGASDSMFLWYSPMFSNWSSRWPEWAKDIAPCNGEPRMELAALDPLHIGLETVDTLSPATGWIAERHQKFAMPTLEPERILGSDLNDRVPPLSSVFKIDGTHTSEGS